MIETLAGGFLLALFALAFAGFLLMLDVEEARHRRRRDSDARTFAALCGNWHGLDADGTPCTHDHLSHTSAIICACRHGGKAATFTPYDGGRPT